MHLQSAGAVGRASWPYSLESVMDISGIDVCELQFDEVIVLQSEAASDSATNASLYESPGYPIEVGSYALVNVEGVLYREDITAEGGYMFPVVDKSDLKRIGLL